METKLSRTEFKVFEDVLERIGAKDILDYDDCMFKFMHLSTNGFLRELPAVVNILSQHKEEIRYEEFVRTLGNVVEILTEIHTWEFCLNHLNDLVQSLYDSNLRIKKGGEV